MQWTAVKQWALLVYRSGIVTIYIILSCHWRNLVAVQKTLHYIVTVRLQTGDMFYLCDSPGINGLDGDWWQFGKIWRSVEAPYFPSDNWIRLFDFSDFEHRCASQWDTEARKCSRQYEWTKTPIAFTFLWNLHDNHDPKFGYMPKDILCMCLHKMLDLPLNLNV